MKTIASIFTALVISLFVVACGNAEATHSQESTGQEPATEAAVDTPEDQGPEYTSAYICPMHCKGSGSDQPGTCPVCGMDYIANADHQGEGHSH